MKALAAIAAFLCVESAAAGLRDVDFEPHPGARLPLNVQLYEEGRAVRLDRYFGAAPVVLQLGYLGCVNLCSTTLIGAAEALSGTGLTPGRDYVALFMSIDPRDESMPPHRREGWHFLTGAASAAAVARAVGFRYAYEAQSGEFAHPAGFVILAPDGTVAGYFSGVRFDAPGLRGALLAAGRGASAPSAFERLLLVCFHDPQYGRYTAAVLDAMRIAMALFLAALGALAWRRLR